MKAPLKDRHHLVGLEAANNHVVNCLQGRTQSYNHKRQNFVNKLSELRIRPWDPDVKAALQTLISALWAPERWTWLSHNWIPDTWKSWHNQLLLVETTKCVVTCYTSIENWYKTKNIILLLDSAIYIKFWYQQK